MSCEVSSLTIDQHDNLLRPDKQNHLFWDFLTWAIEHASQHFNLLWLIGLLQWRSTDQAVWIQPGCGAGAPNGGDSLPLPVGRPKQEEEAAEEEEQRRAMEENPGKVG